MTIDEACKKAVLFVGAPDNSIVRAFESGRYYIFEIPGKDESYCSPICVSKGTGLASVFFPPEHSGDIKAAKRISVPAKYRG